MATLTETAYYARKTIKWGSIGLVSFIILRLLFLYTLNIILQALPPPPLKPNNYFSKLPKLEFPQVASPSTPLTFTLQTIEGTVPHASSAARVYFMPKNRSNLLSLSRSQTFAGRIGFTATPKQIENTTYYRWIDLKSPLRTLEMDIVSNHFTLNYAFPHDLTLFTERQVPTREQALSEVISFFQSAGLTTFDLNIAIPKTTYLKLVGDQLEPTTSLSQADAVRIDLFRKNYDGMKILTEDPFASNVQILFSGSRRQDRRILQVKYKYWPIDSKTLGIYKLKTSETAWQELKTGNGFLANFTPDQTRVTITNVYLAYYDSSTPQYYMQPIFVFEGEKNFFGYVPAVAPPWTD